MFIDPHILTGYQPRLNALPIRYPSIIAPAIPATLSLASASHSCTLVFFFLSLNKHHVNIITDSTTYTCKHGSTPILSVRNYHSWKNNITNLLAIDDSLDIILSTELAPDGNIIAQSRDFRKQLQCAFRMIWLSTEPSIRTFLNRLGHRDPHIAWEALVNDMMWPHPSLHVSLPLPTFTPP